MKKEFTATGKTINEAVDNACAELNVNRDDVEIEILDTPSKGFLGLGSTVAKVKVVYEMVQSGEGETDINEYIENLFHKMGIKTVKATYKTENNELKINVEGDGMGAIIGRRGETLDALQYLVSLFVNRNKEVHIRVTLDIENYRQKRTETLERLAKRLASSAVAKKGSVYLEPMQAYERRIIHATLQDFKDVSTTSTGVDPRRKVIINYTPEG